MPSSTHSLSLEIFRVHTVRTSFFIWALSELALTGWLFSLPCGLVSSPIPSQTAKHTFPLPYVNTRISFSRGPSYQKSYGICIACFVVCIFGVTVHRTFTTERVSSPPHAPSLTLRVQIKASVWHASTTSSRLRILMVVSTRRTLRRPRSRCRGVSVMFCKRCTR